MTDYFTLSQVNDSNISIVDSYDGYIMYTGTIYINYNNDQYIASGHVSTSSWRGYIEWDIDDIPSTASITTVKIIYHGYTFSDYCLIRKYNDVNRPSEVASLAALYGYCINGTLLCDDATFPAVGIQKIVTLGTGCPDTNIGCSTLASQLPYGWFAISIPIIDEAATKSSSLRSGEYYAANPPPTLYVEYNYTSTVSLNIPINAQKRYDRNIEKYVFRDGTYTAQDIGKSGITLELTGMEYSTATATFSTIYIMMNSGEPVTITGLPDTTMNDDWLINNFEYNAVTGIPNLYQWNMTLQSIT